MTQHGLATTTHVRLSLHKLSCCYNYKNPIMKSDYRVESKHMHLTVMNVFHQMYKIIIASDNTRTVYTHCMVSFPSEARLQVNKIIMYLLNASTFHITSTL